ncbi:MAG: TIGR04222 domain-containing membrane protein, partial [Pseudomonadota bacterium]
MIIIGYLFLLIFGIVIGKRWLNAADDSNQYSMPDVTCLNSYEIAALRDGRKGLIQTALFELWNRKLITSRGKKEQAEVKSVENQQPKDEIEQAIYDFAHTTRKPADFFSDSGLHVRLDSHLKPINQHLEQLHLKPTEHQLKQELLRRGIIWSIILGGGVIIFGFSALFFLIFFSLILNILFFTPNKRQTQLGCRYYNKLLKHFEWMKSEEKSNIDPAFLISIFGISALANFGLFDSFEQAFAKTDSSGTADGGCGGG